MSQFKVFFSVLAIVFFAAISIHAESSHVESLSNDPMTMNQPSSTNAGTIVQIIKLKSKLAEEQLLEKARERQPQFAANSGIIQKYYVKLGEGEYAGVYIWDSIESLKKFKQSELAASIPQAYEITEAPSVEIGNILFQLRED